MNGRKIEKMEKLVENPEFVHSENGFVYANIKAVIREKQMKKMQEMVKMLENKWRTGLTLLTKTILSNQDITDWLET